MIVSRIGRLRDPYILLHDGCYYAYGTAGGHAKMKTESLTENG